MEPAVTGACTWVEQLRRIPGTLVSAGTETIQVYPFDGRIKNLVLIVSEYHPWVVSWRHLGIRVFCLEEQAGNPENNTGRLLLHEKTLAFMKTLPQPVSIVMFKPDAHSAQTLRDHGFNIAGCDPVLARRLENKLLFPDLAREAGVLVPSTRKIRLVIPKNNGLKSSPLPAFPFICQFAKGFSGNRTFLVTTIAEWQALMNRFPNRFCRVSSIVDGDTWTVNACVFKDGFILVSHPFMQETIVFPSSGGLPKRVGSGGNRWGVYSADAEKGTHDITRKIGAVMHRKGFYGFFGVDIVMDRGSGQFYAIEINPRITASAPVLTPMEMSGESPPLIAAHLGISMDRSWPWRDAPAAPMPGGQRIYRTGGLSIPQALEKCDTGVYRPAGDHTLHRVRNALHPGDLDAGELLVWRPATLRCASELMRVVYRLSSEPFPSFLQINRP